jgi:cell division protein ZapA (FtsZ GTPase activity inhibitor)
VIVIVIIITIITITITVIVALLFLLLLLQMSREGASVVDKMRENKRDQRFQAVTAVWLRP